MEIYKVNLCIQSECGNIENRKTSVLGHISSSGILLRSYWIWEKTEKANLNELTKKAIFHVINGHSFSLQIGQESVITGVVVLNNTYELNENPTYNALQQNTESNISIAIDPVTSTDDKKHTCDDHTLNFFLNNVESTISDKQMKLHPKLYFKKSQLVTDSTKDAGLCGFLISFESADMSPSSNKESKDTITEE